MIGVRYVGFLAENSGFGQATRLHLHSLARAGVPVCGRSVLMGPQAPGDVQVCAARYPTTARICARRRAYDHVLLHVAGDRRLELSTPAPHVLQQHLETRLTAFARHTILAQRLPAEAAIRNQTASFKALPIRAEKR